MICQSVNLSRKIAVQNAGCVFGYFCRGHKNNFGLQFRISFKLVGFMLEFYFSSSSQKLLLKYAICSYFDKLWSCWKKKELLFLLSCNYMLFHRAQTIYSFNMLKKLKRWVRRSIKIFMVNEDFLIKSWKFVTPAKIKNISKHKPNSKCLSQNWKADLLRPGRFPGIKGNAGNHGNGGKFHKIHRILNQIKRNINKLWLRKSHVKK